MFQIILRLIAVIIMLIGVILIYDSNVGIVLVYITSIFFILMVIFFYVLKINNDYKKIITIRASNEDILIEKINRFCSFLKDYLNG